MDSLINNNLPDDKEIERNANLWLDKQILDYGLLDNQARHQLKLAFIVAAKWMRQEVNERLNTNN